MISELSKIRNFNNYAKKKINVNSCFEYRYNSTDESIYFIIKSPRYVKHTRKFNCKKLFLTVLTLAGECYNFYL